MDDDSRNEPSQPPPASRRAAATRRPWYLILALGICFVVGASTAFNAMYLIDVYRQPETDVTSQFTDIKSDAARQKLQAAAQGLLDAIHAEQSRLFPISVAELVLGITLFALAVLAMVGRSGARRALVQVILVSTLVAGVEWFATPKFRAAEREAALVQLEVDSLESGMDPQMVAIQVATQRKLIPFVMPIRLVVRGAIALLVVLALTRRRTYQFYESMAEERNAESGS
jgi:disulfide bond formation protein DsbB